MLGFIYDWKVFTHILLGSFCNR